MRFCKYWAIGAIVITLLSACSDFRRNSPLPLQGFTLHACGIEFGEHLTNRNIELITSVYGISSKLQQKQDMKLYHQGQRGVKYYIHRF